MNEPKVGSYSSVSKRSSRLVPFCEGVCVAVASVAQYCSLWVPLCVPKGYLKLFESKPASALASLSASAHVFFLSLPFHLPLRPARALFLVVP